VYWLLSDIVLATSHITQNEIKILHNSELFVEINLREDDPNHSCTNRFVQVCAIKKSYIRVKKVIFWHRGHSILRLKCGSLMLLWYKRNSFTFLVTKSLSKKLWASTHLADYLLVWVVLMLSILHGIAVLHNTRTCTKLFVTCANSCSPYLADTPVHKTTNTLFGLTNLLCSCWKETVGCSPRHGEQWDQTDKLRHSLACT
jgi:hypothetical protein